MIIQYKSDEASDSWVSFRSTTERFYAMCASGRNGLTDQTIIYKLATTLFPCELSV